MCACSQAERTLDQVVSWVGSYSPGPFKIPYHYPVRNGGERETPDMTLIASAWSPEGFAIAADGLSFITSSLVPKEQTQKIFFTPFINGNGFAFAWAGLTAYTFASGNSLDFKNITPRSDGRISR
jgi:hypothetical protein